jgi:flagella basal body P-ring formation protein FlgA
MPGCARLTERVRTFAVVALLALDCASHQPASAQERVIPSPRLVIYPGEPIREDMLADISVEAGDPVGVVAASRAELIGKVARRTLLPGHAIPVGAVNNPRVVINGAEVRLVYIEGGLTIVTTGAALQDGGVGDVIKIRNSDSGLTISGEVQPDGAVKVNGG